MGEAYITRRGGSNPLNFKVAGNPQPTNPKENTIWVNTDQKITGCQFASDDPNLVNFHEWISGSYIVNGTKTISGNSVTLNASAENCYTQFSGDTAPEVLCNPGETYIYEWTHTGSPGRVYIFPNKSTTGMVWVDASVGKIEYTVPAGVNLFSFRIGVQTAGTSATYSNIRISKKDRAFKPGSVWITTGTSSSVAFNALKNSVMVYPLSVKQYVSGAWVEKTAKIYQNGAWRDFIDWDTYLYRYDHPNNPTWKALANTTVSINGDGILIATSTTTASHCAFGMEEAIDITNVSALRFVYSSATLNYGNRFGVTASKPTSGDTNQYSTYVAANTTESLSTFKEVVLDVSALSGLVYVSGCLVGTFYIKEVQKV